MFGHLEVSVSIEFRHRELASGALWEVKQQGPCVVSSDRCGHVTPTVTAAPPDLPDLGHPKILTLLNGAYVCLPLLEHGCKCQQLKIKSYINFLMENKLM